MLQALRTFLPECHSASLEKTIQPLNRMLHPYIHKKISIRTLTIYKMRFLNTCELVEHDQIELVVVVEIVVILRLWGIINS